MAPRIPPFLRIPPWVIERLKSPVATAMALTLGMKVGQEVYRLRLGEISLEEFKKRAGFHAGTITGTMAGALAGSLAGRLVPGVGSMAGAFVGGMLGQLTGEHAIRKGADRIEPLVVKTVVPPEPVEEPEDHDPAPPRRTI